MTDEFWEEDPAKDTEKREATRRKIKSMWCSGDQRRASKGERRSTAVDKANQGRAEN